MLLNLKRVVLCVVLAAACLTAAPARAGLHLWFFAEAFTSVDGTVQFIRMRCPPGATGEIFLAGATITCSNIGNTMTNTFTFPSGLSGNTSDRDLLIATSNFASVPGGFAPDFVIPANFLFQAGGTLNFSNFNIWSYGALPTDGQASLLRNGSIQPMNSPKNYSTNTSGSILVPPGACCVGAACSATVQISCGGTWTQGASCASNPCAPATGACCAGATCRVSTAANCIGTNTVFHGAPGCNAPGNNLSPCCRANHDQVAGITVGDIFAFLGDWFAGSLRADFVGNGTATPQVPSIFGFLTAWFAGGC